MGQRVDFRANSHTCSGYVATPQSGKGPAVVVIQEWWGLVSHIQDVVDRFAREGFLAIAPDLYHGKTTKSPDEAGKMLMELDAERAEREIAGAGEYLLGRPDCTSKTYGVVGFCMGGALAQYTGAKESKVGATVSFYGGFKKLSIPWENLHGPIFLIAGEKDKGVTPESVRKTEQELKQLGKRVQAKVYANADHAFFNDTGTRYNAAAATDAWSKTLAWFAKYLKA
jgi:carboxymethylenebutenolidase